MFLRSKIRRKDGKDHRAWSVVENRRVHDGRVVQRQVLYLGEINDNQKAAWSKAIEVFDEGAGQSKQIALFPEDRLAPVLDCDVVSIRLVNYAERHRAGLRVGTALTEATANFLVNRRMNKSQQMRWTRRGADLLLQVRCAVYNGTLGFRFGQRFEPPVGLPSEIPMAA